MNLKHGAYSTRRRPLSIRKYASKMRQGFIRDYGNGDEGSLSLMQVALIDDIVSTAVKSKMMFKWMWKHGVVVEGGEPQPCMGRLTRFDGRIRRNIKRLEDSKASPVFDAMAYFSDKYEHEK